MHCAQVSYQYHLYLHFADFLQQNLLSQTIQHKEYLSLVLVHRTVVFYNKTHSIFHFGPVSIPNFALKGCHPKVHTKHYFLSKYLFAVVIDKLSFLEYNIVNCTYSPRTPRYLLHNHVSPFLIISQMHSQDASHALRGEREETRCRTLDQENLRDRTNME